MRFEDMSIAAVDPLPTIPLLILPRARHGGFRQIPTSHVNVNWWSKADIKRGHDRAKFTRQGLADLSWRIARKCRRCYRPVSRFGLATT